MTLYTDVTCFDIKTNKWRVAPSLNIARYMHASCAIGKTVYVFCGKVPGLLITNSIERSRVTGRSQMEPWELLQVNGSSLAPRHSLGVCPLNQTEIVIIGGQSLTNNPDGLNPTFEWPGHSNAVLFDTESMTFKADYSWPRGFSESLVMDNNSVVRTS